MHSLIFPLVSHRLIWDPVIGEIARYTLESGAPVPECIEKGILPANMMYECFTDLLYLTFQFVKAL